MLSVKSEVVMEALDLSRQMKLVNKDAVESCNIKVFGTGSVGSHVIKALAKTGFKSIDAYDMDVVGTENIAAQAFDFSHIGMKKTEAVKKLCEDAAGISINVFDGEVTNDTEITPEPNTIYMCFFDSFHARKLIFDKLKGWDVLFVDARIGKYELQYYFINCGDEDQVKRYEKSFPADLSGGSELECGEKACAPINLQLAGMIVMNLVSYLADKPYVKVFVGNAENRKSDIVVMG